MKNFLTNKTANRVFRWFTLVLVFTTLIFTILASVRDYGTYVYDPGTSGSNTVIPAVTDATGKITSWKFADSMSSPIFGALLYGSAATVKWAMTLCIVAFIAALAQIVKLFNPKHVNKNFVNSLVLAIAMVITVGFSSGLYILIFAMLSLIPIGLQLAGSVFVEFKGVKEYA